MESAANKAVRTPRAWRFLVPGALTLVAVGATTPPAGASPHAKSVTVVKTSKSAKYGTILVSVKGLTLYTYAHDSKNHSACTGGCLSAWPALTVPSGETPVGSGVSGIGEFTRPNGSRQVTFKGKPLYFFTSDTKAGQVTGNGVNGFSVVAPSGRAKTTTTTARSGYGY